MKSTSENAIIVFDEINLARRRIVTLLQGYDIHVYEASKPIELFNILSDEGLNIRLIIMDIGNDMNDGFGILSKIKEKRSDIPVFILTSNNKRIAFIRGIAEGASDYILKPFDDAYLLPKVLRIFHDNRETDMPIYTDTQFVFDIHSYLNTEFKKSQKGKYEITVLMSTFFLPVTEFTTDLENKYIQVSELFYQNFKSILWDTDVFEQYGSQTFIGIFPYCGLYHMEKIQKKMQDSFDNVIIGNKELASFDLAISTITYPTQATDTKDLLLTLGMNMKQKIDEMKKKLIP